MRSINKILQDRLIAQSEELDLIGMVKTAELLTSQLEQTPVRSVEDRYVYASQDFEKDVQSAMWGIILRSADFHNSSIDAIEAQKIVDYYSDAMISDFRKMANVQHGVGAYEPAVPGEVKGVVITEVDE